MITNIVNFAKRHITLSLCSIAALIALATIGGVTYYADDDIAQVQKSCNLKNSEACFMLGEAYLYQYYMTKDNQNLAKAKHSYQESCNLNNGLACTVAGILPANDSTTAKDFLQKGCDLNTAYGCTYLGFMYYMGQEVEKDLVKARMLLQKGCMLNEGSGCFLLGQMYQSGDGVEFDLDAARILFQKGCELNNTYACDNFQQLNQQYQALIPVEDKERLKIMDQELMLYQQYNDQMSSKLESTRALVLDYQNEHNVFNITQ